MDKDVLHNVLRIDIGSDDATCVLRQAGGVKVIEMAKRRVVRPTLIAFDQTLHLTHIVHLRWRGHRIHRLVHRHVLLLVKSKPVTHGWGHVGSNSPYHALRRHWGGDYCR